MTTVTKIFIVLVCLFAFIFTPMVISFAARTRNWRLLAEQLQEFAETALAHERSTIATAASTVEHYKALRKQETERAEASEQRITDLERQIEGLTQQQEELERERDQQANTAHVLSAQMNVVNALNEQLLKETKELAQSELKLQKQLAQCEDDLAALSANNVILARYLRQRKEELADARKENEQLRQTLRLGKATGKPLTSETPSAQPAAAAARGKIRGTVTKVNAARGLASIDIGSASGVTKGMVMVVFRGEQYVCDITITEEITRNEAVGQARIPDGQRIRVGDNVMDLPSFAAE